MIRVSDRCPLPNSPLQSAARDDAPPWEGGSSRPPPCSSSVSPVLGRDMSDEESVMSSLLASWLNVPLARTSAKVTTPRGGRAGGGDARNRPAGRDGADLAGTERVRPVAALLGGEEAGGHWPGRAAAPPLLLRAAMPEKEMEEWSEETSEVRARLDGAGGLLLLLVGGRREEDLFVA